MYLLDHKSNRKQAKPNIYTRVARLYQIVLITYSNRISVVYDFLHNKRKTWNTRLLNTSKRLPQNATYTPQKLKQHKLHMKPHANMSEFATKRHLDIPIFPPLSLKTPCQHTRSPSLSDILFLLHLLIKILSRNIINFSHKIIIINIFLSH